MISSKLPNDTVRYFPPFFVQMGKLRLGAESFPAVWAGAPEVHIRRRHRPGEGQGSGRGSTDPVLPSELTTRGTEDLGSNPKH